MWRNFLTMVSLLTILVGIAQMELGFGNSSVEGRHASMLSWAADLGCSQDERVDATGDRVRDCCVAVHCAQCLAVAQPRLLWSGLRSDRDTRTDFGSALLTGRSVLPEMGPPKLV